MGRLIGLDYGRKRVGIAVTDECQFIASPLKTVELGDIFCFLDRYLQEHVVEGVVVGKPMRLDGGVCELGREVDGFVLRLKERFGVEVFVVDERFTSVMATKSRLEGGFKRRARRNKAALDAVSATFILRSFLASREG